MEKTEKQGNKQITCAIYTRVSTTERLEQEFTSLDNQRESAESFIASQKSESWVYCPNATMTRDLPERIPSGLLTDYHHKSSQYP